MAEEVAVDRQVGRTPDRSAKLARWWSLKLVFQRDGLSGQLTSVINCPSPEYRVLKEVSNTDFLQAVTLMATAARRTEAATVGIDEERLPRIGCKRKDMLDPALDEYRRFAPLVVQGFKDAAKFLRQQYLFDTKFLPYGTQLIPLAAILSVLGEHAEPAGAQQKLARWYWCGVFGELYGGSTETRFSHDLPETVGWVRGTGAEPRTIRDARFSESRLLTLRTRKSAAYKGIYALLMKEGAVDWRTGEKTEITEYFAEAVDIHHIFPQAWCERENIARGTYNSIVNKTPLTGRTNRIIGGAAPSSYLPRLAKNAEVEADTVAEHIRTRPIRHCSPRMTSRAFSTPDSGSWSRRSRRPQARRSSPRTGTPPPIRWTRATKTDRLPSAPCGISPEIIPGFEQYLHWYAQQGADCLVAAGERGDAPFRRSTFGRKWRNARAELGMDGFRFYDLRHTGNVLAASTGASLRDLMAHSSVRAALIYQHATAE